MNEIYLTPNEVAKKLRINVRTVHNLIKYGELAAFKAGKQWRIPAAEVDAMIERNTNKGVNNHVKR
jgi:putative molybdopterin biosynthesis protein